MFELPDLSTLGVVPILVNAGAAIVPAIAASLASVVAVLFKPKEWVRVCRQRPYVPVIIVALGVGIFLFVDFVVLAEPTADPQKRPQAAAEASRTDWREVALKILENQALSGNLSRTVPGVPSLAAIAGGGNTVHVATSTAPATTSGPAAAGGKKPEFREQTTPLQLGNDFSRCGYDGGPVPLELKDAGFFMDEVAKENAMTLSSPVVAGRWVYGAFCVLDPPSNYGSLFCLDARTMQKRWQLDAVKDGAKDIELKGFFSSPAVTADGKYVLVGQGLHPDSDTNLLCINAATGALKWRLPSKLHMESSPAIDGDMVVIGCGAIEGDNHKPKTHPGYVVAVRISDGKELWRHDVADPESSPAIADGVAYIGSGFNGNAVVALRTESDAELAAKGLKRELWRFDTPYPMTGAITIAGGLVIAGGGNGDFVRSAPEPAGIIMALDRKTGQPKWQKKVTDSVLGAVAVADGKAVATCGSGEVFVLDVATGEVLWQTKVLQGAPILAAPAFTGRYVYVLNKEGNLCVLDIREKKLLESHYVNSPSKAGEMGMSLSSPTVAGGRVFVGTETGGLRCLIGGRFE
jgi:outer membrane protein assembly factor BamB